MQKVKSLSNMFESQHAQQEEGYKDSDEMKENCAKSP